MQEAVLLSLERVGFGRRKGNIRGRERMREGGERREREGGMRERWETVKEGAPG